MTHSARRLNKVAQMTGALNYLEIGVRMGATFREVKIPNRTGVDPDFRFDTAALANETTHFVSKTSDTFFSEESISSKYDVTFIDGLHTFEQVVRDFTNVLAHSSDRSAILIDDTKPSDVYSAIPDQLLALRRRAEASDSTDRSWHGDVFKAVFFIHDFYPSINYRTIIGSGNVQTLAWRAAGVARRPLFNNLETISRLTYFDLLNHLGVLHMATEEDAMALFSQEVMGVQPALADT